MAAANAPLEVVKLLVEAGATGIDSEGLFGLSPLTLAMLKESKDVVAYLFQQINSTMDARTMAFISYLKEDKRLQYPLFHLAAVASADSMLQKLIDKGGVDVNERVRGHSAIQLAVNRWCNTSTLHLLVQFGAKINNPEMLFFTQLYMTSLIKEIITMGADVNMIAVVDNHDNGINPLLLHFMKTNWRQPKN